MKIKIEDTDGKKKYWVNDVAYDRIEDMPAQYRAYFKDENNNGIPDQFDDLMESVHKMQGGSGVLGGLFGTVRSESKKLSPATKVDYSSGEEGTPIGPLLLKIAVAIVLVGLAAWVYPMLTGPKVPVNADSPPITLSDSVADQTDIPSVQGGTTASTNDGLILTIDDPNEPPYHMQGVVSSRGKKIISFELPDGELVEGTAASLQIATDLSSKTNLDERSFRVDLLNISCAPGEGEIPDGSVTIGKNIFTKSNQVDGGDQTIRYALEKDGRCIVFAIMLHSGNPATYDPPVKEFDFDEQVRYMENILGTIKMF